MTVFTEFSVATTVLLHWSCAMCYLGLIVYLLGTSGYDHTRLALAGCCLVTVLWSGVMAWRSLFPDPRIANLLDLAQTASWLGFVIHLYHKAIPNGSRLRTWLSGIGFLLIAAIGMVLTLGPDSGHALVGAETAPLLVVQLRLLLAVCMILLIENLYRNSPDDLRWHVVLPCVALGGLSIYNLFLFSDALLFGHLSAVLLEGRAVLMMFVAPLLALSAQRNGRRWFGGIQVSHRAVFYSASLIVIGVFLVGLASAGEVLRRFGNGRSGDWAAVLEISMVCGGVLTSAIFLTSGSARSNLRHIVRRNLLSRRYDYRLEWLCCINTLSRADSDVALHTRAIKAVAHTLDSPGGMVFLRDAHDGAFCWAGSWNLPMNQSQIPPGHPLIAQFRTGNWVVEAPAGMPWVEGQTDLWLAIPLCHAKQLLGFVVVSRPRAAMTPDSEVFDLLRIIAQEVSSYIAEQHAVEALVEARQLTEYGQRFAFVAHDIKNVASQLSLLVANAEHHIANPDFQQDMLTTVRASVQKITALLARLKAPTAEPVLAATGVQNRLNTIIGANDPGRRARIDLRDNLPSGRDTVVAMEADAFDAAITHLVDNAFEASSSDARIAIVCSRTGRTVLIDIVDQGCGMTKSFINEQLFRPFQSSKRGGFGIGVYQVRELARRAGGDLTVSSAAGRGTTMRLSMQMMAERAEEVATMQGTL